MRIFAEKHKLFLSRTVYTVVYTVVIIITCIQINVFYKPLDKMDYIKVEGSACMHDLAFKLRELMVAV